MEREFKLWDVDTFNEVLEATKIKYVEPKTESQHREEIMKAVDRIKHYLFALDKMEKISYHSNAVEVITSNVSNDWANFYASYPQFDMTNELDPMDYNSLELCGTTETNL